MHMSNLGVIPNHIQRSNILAPRIAEFLDPAAPDHGNLPWSHGKDSRSSTMKDLAKELAARGILTLRLGRKKHIAPDRKRGESPPEMGESW